MRLIILILTAFIYKNSISQATKSYNNYYFEIEKHNSINKHIITMASVQGSMQYALNVLDNKYFDKNHLDFHLLKGFVYYNIYGKENAFHYLDTCKTYSIKENERLFVKSWWSKTSGNIDDYNLYLKELNNKYPENLFAIRFSLIDYLNIRDKNSKNLEPGVQEELSFKVDSILKLKNLSATDSIYFLLMKCDILSPEISLFVQKNKHEDEIIKILDFLWQNHSSQLNRLKLKEQLQSLSSKGNKQLLLKIEAQEEKSLPQSSLSRVFKLLYDSENNYNINELEQKTADMLFLEKDSIQQEKIKGLLNFFALYSKIDENFGFIFVNKYNFSKAFRQKIKPVFSKEQLTQLLKKSIKENKEYSAADIQDINTLLNDKQWETLSNEEVSAVLGTLVYATQSVEWHKTNLLHNIPIQHDTIDMNDYKNLTVYVSFIKDKPLFYENRFIKSYLKAADAAEFEDALKEINQAIQKYPGSLALKKYKLDILNENSTFVNQNKSFYFSEILQTVTDIFLVNQSEGMNFSAESNTYFASYFTYSSPPSSRMPSFEYIATYSDSIKRTALLKTLETAIQQHPYHGNLYRLYCRLLLTTNDIESYIRAYLNAFSNVTTFNETYYEDFALDDYALRDVNTDFLKQEYQLFTSKNNPSTINVSDAVSIPVLMQLQQYVPASEMMANNMAYTSSTPYYYASNYYEKLFTQINNDSILLLCCNNILSKNPDKDVAYVYVALLQSANKDEKGMHKTFEMLRSTKNIQKIIEITAAEEVANVIKSYKKKLSDNELKQFTDEFLKTYPWCKRLVSEI